MYLENYLNEKKNYKTSFMTEKKILYCNIHQLLKFRNCVPISVHDKYQERKFGYEGEKKSQKKYFFLQFLSVEINLTYKKLLTWSIYQCKIFYLYPPDLYSFLGYFPPSSRSSVPDLSLPR